MVELLTVIGIITILVAMIFVALKYASNSAARNRTKTELEALKGMLAEMDAANQFGVAPTNWVWYNNFTGSPSTTNGPFRVVRSYFQAAGQLNSDFWNYPFGVPMESSTTPPVNIAYWDALDAPGDVTDSSGAGSQQYAQRNASFAVLNTQLAMQLLATIPANRTALQNLSGDATMLPNWTSSAPLQAPRLDDLSSSVLLGVLKEDGSDTNTGSTFGGPNYPANVHVTLNGHTFVSMANTSGASIAPVAGTVTLAGTAGWSDESVSSSGTAVPRAVPILLDGWNNPIIFVPSSGLRVKLLAGERGYNPADPNQDYIIVSPEGHVTNQGTAGVYVDRPGRPFFASAGPDGDFTKGDDNLYSFEN
jgi:type II secretory pathway pseudopilin PulG